MSARRRPAAPGWMRLLSQSSMRSARGKPSGPTQPSRTMTPAWTRLARNASCKSAREPNRWPPLRSIQSFDHSMASGLESSTSQPVCGNAMSADVSVFFNANDITRRKMAGIRKRAARPWGLRDSKRHSFLAMKSVCFSACMGGIQSRSDRWVLCMNSASRLAKGPDSAVPFNSVAKSPLATTWPWSKIRISLHTAIASSM